MVDLYADDVTLTDIKTKQSEQILFFGNKEKDETIALNVSDSELFNIFLKVKMRCEALNLIPITDFKANRGDGESDG